MELIYHILAIVLGYLFGSVPFALVIGKLFYKTDIRQHGSGNLGASNAGRVLGKAAGVSVTILDVLKAFFAMLVFSLIQDNQLTILLAGFFATLGHAFPVFAGFKGGKSVATYYGFLLGVCVFLIQTAWPFVIGIVIFFSMLKLFKMSSLASMTSTSISALSSLFFVSGHYWISLALIIVVLFIIYRHKSNIERIKNKTESKVTWI